MPLIEATGLHKTHRLGAVSVAALRGVSVNVEAGEFVVVAGPSGSGKSTLLNLLGSLDQPDAGRIVIAGVELRTCSARATTLLRRRSLGFVFQSFNLVPVLSAYENVEYPLWIDGVAPAERRRRTTAALASVGLEQRQSHRPDQLSGGERQRVALARALVHEPLVLFADEPTANLDSTTGLAIVDLLVRLQAEHGTTMLLATHDPAILEFGRRKLLLHDGALVSDEGRA